MRLIWLWFFLLGMQISSAALPFSTVFKGQDTFARLVRQAEQRGWQKLPIGQRTMTVGLSLVGTPYKSYTLEVDDRIEAPSVNLQGLDCWTFFEISLAFARMLDEPRQAWTPQTMLRYIELDRYRGGRCDGGYLSRLHYLEDWAADNDRRGLVKDLTRELGGVPARHEAREMTVGWKGYRYLRANRALLEPLRKHEERITRMKVYHIPKTKVAAMEHNLRDGDIVGIWSHMGGGRVATSHVGLAHRDRKGTLRFVHASSPRNSGKVIIDSRLSEYLDRFSGHAGILVARPVR